MHRAKAFLSRSRKTQQGAIGSSFVSERALRFALLIATLFALTGCARAAQTADKGTFSGESALTFTRKAVEFGPRPAGSPANRALQVYILDQLKSCQCEVIEDAFDTPQAPMRNIVARFKGTSGKAIAVSGHFDTKPFPGRSFVGANDGGSSTGFLLEFARILAGKPRKDDVYVIFFDGEEAFGEWSDTDKLYGSRHLAYRWYQDGTMAKLKALINVDMIGDRSLNIERDSNSDSKLTDLIWRAAADLGYARHFLTTELGMDDDHIPFATLGIPAADIIDFDYSHWHEDSDTFDKLSAESLQVVGRVVEEAVKRLEAQ